MGKEKKTTHCSSLIHSLQMNLSRFHSGQFRKLKYMLHNKHVRGSFPFVLIIQGSALRMTKQHPHYYKLGKKNQQLKEHLKIPGIPYHLKYQYNI